MELTPTMILNLALLIVPPVALVLAFWQRLAQHIRWTVGSEVFGRDACGKSIRNICLHSGEKKKTADGQIISHANPHS